VFRDCRYFSVINARRIVRKKTLFSLFTVIINPNLEMFSRKLNRLKQ